MDADLTRWHDGVAAFDRGELPPSDPAAAEGWYYAENASAAARRARHRVDPGFVLPALLLLALIGFAIVGAAVAGAWMGHLLAELLS